MTVVIKVGGHALDDLSVTSPVLGHLAEDLASVSSPLVVHGGGPQIATLLADVGKESTFLEGLRVTDDETMSYVAMALSLVNALIVAAWQNHGLRVAGVNGLDGGVLTASPRGSQWGRAGDTPHVDVSLLNLLMAARIVPVINPIASDGAGGLLNCNADTAAGAIAGALGADLILLSDVDQIRREATDPTTGVAHATGSEIRALIQSGEIRDGMVPKVNAALDALAGGAPRVLMANGTRAHALANVLTGKGLWTEVVP